MSIVSIVCLLLRFIDFQPIRWVVLRVELRGEVWTKKHYELEKKNYEP